MSDHYQIAADLDADIESARATAARLRDWMISQKIIVAETSDCVLSDESGYAPGSNYALAVSEPWPHLFELATNGVSFIAKHSVFYAAGVGVIYLKCTTCAKSFESNDSWSAAVDEWYAGKGPGILKCEHCSAESPVTQWRHEPPFAFGNVGVKFWNWPPLSEDFLNKLGEVVGHRFRRVHGKI